MKESPQYKRFKHINITGDTLSLSDTRLSVSDRAILALPYADMIARPGGHTARLDGYVLHGQAFKKPKTYLIIEMIPILVYYSYATKYHKLASMFIPGYQCSNIYNDIEKGTLLYKDIQ